jgi:hypothetical protein
MGGGRSKTANPIDRPQLDRHFANVSVRGRSAGTISRPMSFVQGEQDEQDEQDEPDLWSPPQSLVTRARRSAQRSVGRARQALGRFGRSAGLSLSPELSPELSPVQPGEPSMFQRARRWSAGKSAAVSDLARRARRSAQRSVGRARQWSAQKSTNAGHLARGIRGAAEEWAADRGGRARAAVNRFGDEARGGVRDFGRSVARGALRGAGRAAGSVQSGARGAREWAERYTPDSDVSPLARRDPMAGAGPPVYLDDEDEDFGDARQGQPGQEGAPSDEDWEL